MFRLLIDKILLKKINLIILFNALFDGLSQIFDTSHKGNFSFHFFPPSLSLHWFGGIDSYRPSSFLMLHAFISIRNPFGVHNVLRSLRDVVQVYEIRVAR
jgi:hypothetical protein